MVGTVVASPDNFPGIDPTGVANSATALQTFLNSIPDGGIGVIPPGTYSITSRLEMSGKSMTIRAYGARIVSSVTGGGVRMTGGFGTVINVNTITERLTTAGEYGNNGENMWVTDLALASTPSGWKKGDLVKIVADNVPPDPDIATLRSGQHCTVIAASGANVTLAGTLRDEFTTNPRIAKCLTYRMTWEGGSFRNTDAVLSGGTMAQFAFQARALIGPMFRDIDVESVAGPAFDLRHCYGASVLDCSIGNAEDRGSAFYGYGVNDCGEFTTVDNLKARRVRHAYTTGASGTTAGNADLTAFGRAFGAIVSNCVAHGTSNGAFDAHGDGDNISFLNCVAVDCYGGFGLRGTNHRVVGGIVQGFTPGAAVSSSTYSSAKYSHGSIVSGLVMDGIRGDAIYAMNDTAGAGVETRPLYVDNVTIKNRLTSKAVIRADKATVHVGTINVASGGTRVVTTNGGAVVNMERMSADGTAMAANTGGSTSGGGGGGTPPSGDSVANTAEGFANGTVVTVGNSGGTSGDAFNTACLAGSPTASNATQQAGALSYFVNATDGAQTTIGWDYAGATSVTTTFWVRFNANPTGAHTLFAQVRNATAGVANLQLMTDGKVNAQESGFTVVNTSTSSVTLNQWYRVDWTVKKGTTTSNGEITVAMYAASNLVTPFYTYASTARNTGTANLTQLKFGKPNNSGTLPLYLDTLSATWTP